MTGSYLGQLSFFVTQSHFFGDSVIWGEAVSFGVTQSNLVPLGVTLCHLG